MMKYVGIKKDSGTKLKRISLLYIMRVSPLLVCAKILYRVILSLGVPNYCL